jgi:hypothetical protein
LTQQNTETEQVTMDIEALKSDAKMLVDATDALKTRLMTTTESIDVLQVLLREVLPLQKMLAKNLFDTHLYLEEVDGDDYDDEDDEQDGDEGDGEEDEQDGDEGDGEEDDGDELPEGILEIDAPIAERVLVFLRIHGFDLPNGNKDPQTEKLASPMFARVAMIEMLTSLYGEDAGEMIQGLIQAYPNVPLRQELEQAVEAAKNQSQGQNEAQGGTA